MRWLWVGLLAVQAQEDVIDLDLSEDLDLSKEVALSEPVRSRDLNDRLYYLDLTDQDYRIEVYKGEEPVDVVRKTAAELSLDVPQQEKILAHLCEHVVCKQARLRPYTHYVPSAGLLTIAADAQPVEALDNFIATHEKLREFHKWPLLHLICSRIKCQPRSLGTLTINGKLVLDIIDTERPRDLAAKFCSLHNLDGHEQEILKAIQAKVAEVNPQSQLAAPEWDLDITDVGKLVIKIGQDPLAAVREFSFR